jgi:anti-sigma factor RsiW
MSLSRETVMDLMALADGELEGAERARVEALVASDEEARRLMEGFQQSPLGDWIRESHEASNAGHPAADTIADRVMTRAAEAKEPVSLDAVRARRKRAALLAATVVAVAAGIMAYVRSEGTSEPVGRGDVASNEPPRPTVSAPVPAQDTTWAQTGVELEEVESPSAVSVFYVPAVAAPESANASSVVIWIDEGKKPKAGQP